MKHFRPDRGVALSILSVTVPASAEFFVMSMVTAVLNGILTAVGVPVQLQCTRPGGG